MNTQLIPERCPSCESDLTEIGVHLVCTNYDVCPAQQVEKISYWVKESSMDGISDSTIKTLFEQKKIYSIKDLYDLKQKDLEGIDGIGQKKIDNLLEQIRKSREMSITEFISKLGIDLVGEKAVKKLQIKTLHDFWNFKDTSYKIGQNLIKYRDTYRAEIVELSNVLKIKEDSFIINTKGNVCMTGSGPEGRKELTKKIEGMGYSVVDSITKGTNILLVEDVNGNSSKLQKARKLGITLIKYEDFLK